MKTLDNILYERALNSVESKMEAASDLSTWTEANRDYKFQEIKDIADSVADEAVEIIRELIQDREGDKSTLYYMVRTELVGVQLEVLKGFREILDTVGSKGSEMLPVSYDWLNERIQKSYEEGFNLDDQVTDLQESGGEATEL